MKPASSLEHQLNLLWDTFWPYDKEKTLEQWGAILAQEVNKIIGEDETDGEFELGAAAEFRNGLRAEQRRKAGLV